MKYTWRLLALLSLLVMLFCGHVSCVTLTGKVTVMECSFGHVPAKQIQEIETYNEANSGNNELDEPEPGPTPTARSVEL